jgi:hypothetical protein
MAAMAGVAIQTYIQTHEFVAQWQNQSHMMWTAQSKINEEIENKMYFFIPVASPIFFCLLS